MPKDSQINFNFKDTSNSLFLKIVTKAYKKNCITKQELKDLIKQANNQE